MDDAPDPVDRFADAVLARAAQRARAGAVEPPNPLPGLVVRHGEVDRLVAHLPSHRPAAPPADPLDRAVAAAVAALRAMAPEHHRVAALARALHLDEVATQVLALLAAVELDRGRQRLVAYVQDDAGRRQVELGTLATVLDAGPAAALAVADGAPLARAALVRVAPHGPWAGRAVEVAPTLIWWLAGDPSPDPALPPGVTLVDAGAERAEGAPCTTVVGPDRVRRQEVAVAGTAGRRFLVTPAPTDDAGWQAVVREATLGGFGVVVELDDDLDPGGRRWIERTPHLAWSLSSRRELAVDDLPDRPHRELEAPDRRPDGEEWSRVLGEPVDVPPLPLSADQLRRVARVLPARDGDLAAAARRLASGPLDALSERLRPTRSWSDLVLAAGELARLRALASRYRNRARLHDDWGFSPRRLGGLVALFAGPSGTGKTLAAEVVAGDLGLDLYRIELASVTSKWLGETEKHLDAIFDAAEAGNVLLLFDEADAVFGKRGEVTDARDRYANLGTSYLLQRLDRFTGVVVLTTNLRHNLDEAFTRRIDVSVDFAPPGPAEREALWRQAFGSATPLEGLDPAALAARHELTGGSIHQAALSAAFLAADAGTAVTPALVEQALALEYEKLQRLPA